MTGAHGIRALPALVVVVLALVVAERARAAQIVALDVKPTGGVPERLASALSPLFVAELARIDGMSVISEGDVKALLELEAEKATLGCTSESCLAEIADSLGAELLASATVGRVGREYVVTTTLLDVSAAKVIRRATGKAQGSEDRASEAVVLAVHELFRDGLPRELQGPASLSRRGFKAALAGLRRAAFAGDPEVLKNRRRVVLDIVQTELDYDAEPKLELLDLELRRGGSEARRLALAAPDATTTARYLGALGLYRAIRDDWGRVKEIRARARERGVVPSTQALRFEDPEPLDAPDERAWAAYVERSKPARAVVARALTAYEKDDVARFAAEWKKDAGGNAERTLKDERARDARAKTKLSLLPLHAHIPELQERAIETMNSEVNSGNRMVVYLLRTRAGAPDDADTVWLEKEGGEWRISTW